MAGGMRLAVKDICQFKFLRFYPLLVECFLISDIRSIHRIKEHRGCGIEAASYSVGPRAWVPEACVSLRTDDGAKKLWVRSFAHCFAAENVTFANKIEADNWAFNAARAIIDKALPDFDPSPSPRMPLYANVVTRFFKAARRPFFPLQRIRLFKRAE